MKKILKYKLTNEIISIRGHKLYRIKSLRDFGIVKKGDLGGYIESEDNLSHDGRCWVYQNACVFENAKIYDHVMIHDNSRIYGSAEIYNQCYVAGNAIVYGNSKLHNNCIILHFSKIFDNSKLYNVAVCNYSNIFGDAILVGRFRICYKSYIGGTTIINCNRTNLNSISIRLKNIIINQGCWCDIIEENGKTYLISNTLVKKRVIENEEV